MLEEVPCEPVHRGQRDAQMLGDLALGQLWCRPPEQRQDVETASKRAYRVAFGNRTLLSHIGRESISHAPTVWTPKCRATAGILWPSFRSTPRSPRSPTPGTSIRGWLSLSGSSSFAGPGSTPAISGTWTGQAASSLRRSAAC